MNNQMLLDALGGIDDQYIFSAQQRLGLFSSEHLSGTHVAHTLRRKAVYWIAAAMMLFASFTVALAASEDFREAVFRFFRIEQVETVPAHDANSATTPENMTVDSQTSNIGGMLKGTYVHTPVASHAEGGVFLICTDEVPGKQGNHYDAYREENAVLIPLETYAFRETLRVNGAEFRTDFEWTEVDGRSVITYTEPNAPYFVEDFSGAPEKTLFLFYCFDRETWKTVNYPIFVNLRTGEVDDVFAGMGIENLNEILLASVSPDQTKMLLATSDQAIYYADLSQKRLYNVADISGEPITDCSLVKNMLICWCEEEAPVRSGSFGRYRAWSIDLSSFVRKELPTISGRDTMLFGFLNAYSTGRMFAGSCFALQTDADQNAYIVDWESGTSSLVDDFQWSDRFAYIGGIPSPDGKKVLLYEEKVGNSFATLGVIDFTQNRIAQFSRKNTNEVNEFSAYWFDNNKIVIKTDASDVSTDYYVYEILESAHDKAAGW